MNLDHVVYFFLESFILYLPSGSSYYKHLTKLKNKGTLYFSMMLPWEKYFTNNKTDCLVIYIAPIYNMQLCPFPESLLINTTIFVWVFLTEYGVKRDHNRYLESAFLETQLVEFQAEAIWVWYTALHQSHTILGISIINLFVIV